MKKRTTSVITIAAILFIFVLMVKCSHAQTGDLKQAFKDYTTYCDELIPDTVEQTGTVQITDLPVYDGDKIICYKKATADTIWNKVECEKYKDDYDEPKNIGYGYKYAGYYNGISLTNASYILAQKDYNIVVTRKHICHIKRENPSRAGFYQWLFLKLH